MRIIPAADVERALDYEELVERLRRAFRAGAPPPLRHHHDLPVPSEPDGALLLMPAWQAGKYVGVKIVTVMPGNLERSLPAVSATFLLIHGRTGEPVAMIDGASLTVRRTACASALAATYLARNDTKRMLMIGTGAMAPHLIRAHVAVRPIRHVLIWGRDPAKARKLASRMTLRRVDIGWTDDLERAVHGADLVSCATLSDQPLVRGDWLRPGTHVDLVGAFRPDLRESDDAAIRRSRVFVDTYDGALREAGDIVQAIDSGALVKQDIAADLFELTRGEKAGRRFHDQITLFKSVGTALEDLAAARLAVERA